MKKHYDSTLNKHKDEVRSLRSQLESSTKQFVPPKSKDDFHEWAEQQDPTIQGWLYENTSNAKLASRAIDLYKMDRGQSTLTKKEEKDVKKEAAKAISKTKKATDSDVPKKKVWTTSEISKLKPHQFEKFEKEIDLARLEGRIEQR